MVESGKWYVFMPLLPGVCPPSRPQTVMGADRRTVRLPIFLKCDIHDIIDFVFDFDFWREKFQHFAVSPCMLVALSLALATSQAGELELLPLCPVTQLKVDIAGGTNVHIELRCRREISWNNVHSANKSKLILEFVPVRSKGAGKRLFDWRKKGPGYINVATIVTQHCAQNFTVGRPSEAPRDGHDGKLTSHGSATASLEEVATIVRLQKHDSTRRCKCPKET